MFDRTLAEVLMAYADELNRGTGQREGHVNQFPDRRADLEALLRLTERIKKALVPVRPSPTFVTNLARQLVTVDMSKMARAARNYRRVIFIGAAAVGSALSVIGLITYLVRNRTHVKTQIASTG